MLLLFWLLPSLITLQLFIIYNRVGFHVRLELTDYDSRDWIAAFLISVFYPIGLMVMTLYIVLSYDKYGEILTKEIKFKWRKQ
jgi:hypothetical protein